MIFVLSCSQLCSFGANMEKQFSALSVFLKHMMFWMGMFLVARLNGLKVLIPSHMWKCKIQFLEQKQDENH